MSNPDPIKDQLQVLNSLFKTPGWRLLRRWLQAEEAGQLRALLATDPEKVGAIGGYQKGLKQIQMLIDEDQLTKTVGLWLTKES